MFNTCLAWITSWSSFSPGDESGSFSNAEEARMQEKEATEFDLVKCKGIKKIHSYHIHGNRKCLL